MSRKPPANPQEMWEVAVRRKWWIIVPLIVVPSLVMWIGSRLPKQYQSEAIVMVNPQKIPSDYVRQGGDSTQRLEVIQQEVISKPRLRRIAEELGLAGNSGAAGVERAANLIQKNMDVTVIKTGGDDSAITGYKITYTATSPELARAVAAKIADLFVQENASWSSEQALGTHEFISDQVIKAKAQLNAQQQKIQAFKAAHLGALPEQESANLARIAQYQSLQQTNSEAIDRANQQRVYLESVLSESDGEAKYSPATVPSDLQLQLQKAKQELAAAQQIYTDSFPDVISLKQQVASLEQQVKDAPKTRHPIISTAGPTVTQQLQSQLIAVQQEIKSRTERQTELEAELRAVQGQVEVVPEIQSQYEQLTRDYQELQKNYESLLEKQQSAGMVAALQQSDDSGGFQIVDPATLPLAPSGPNLRIIDAAGLVGGILLGLILAVLADMRDATIHSAEELEMYLALPMIGSLPNYEREMTRRRGTGPRRPRRPRVVAP